MEFLFYGSVILLIIAIVIWAQNSEIALSEPTSTQTKDFITANSSQDNNSSDLSDDDDDFSSTSDEITDPSYCYLPYNIYHGSCMGDDDSISSTSWDDDFSSSFWDDDWSSSSWDD